MKLAAKLITPSGDCGYMADKNGDHEIAVDKFGYGAPARLAEIVSAMGPLAPDDCIKIERLD